MFERETALFFVGVCTVGKSSNSTSGEANFKVGYHSERLADFLAFSKTGFKGNESRNIGPDKI